MRVCVVSPYSWAFPNGVPKHVSLLSDHLKQRGHEVAVISPDDPPDRITRLLHPRLGNVRPLPGRISPVGRTLSLYSNGTLIGIALSPRVFTATRRAMERFRPDVVHVHEPLVPLAGWAAVRAAKGLGVPVVGTFHAHYPDGCAHYRYFDRILAPVYRSLDARVAVSAMAAKTVVRHFGGEFRIVPNGVDLERFSCPQGGGARNRREILFVGRSAPRKGLPVLLDAFERLLGDLPQARLVIVGSQRKEVPLPESVSRNVEVRGMVSEGELVRAMCSASVLCAPSVRAESFGMVLIEAMAAGLPVLASDIPGYDSVVSHGKNGLLSPPGDPEALKDALLGLLGDPALRERLAAEGRRDARRYAWATLAGELESVYRSVGAAG
ncbi:Glycosyltransferase [Rubrobacter radiotolerans]|uniref:Glycosyltransferase n=1 Tax=Rubrobacter radiotolerans TaxID=42256 RepID=A0A023X0S7_RUBRA|nr:glycosyltransferase family 4 protein [Rubrobacter radiotolerans]AHY45664.1 Glycosyltransferase [Rubrobacter radiotolerans]MDX5893078.1 glycosyltransferase family 4 protein [Rubrobacter radiotolerans]SMC03015.1 phosphatidylinositol alpha-mannosyltransferase [Rubrobacter radiotolerans DSM 5868]